VQEIQWMSLAERMIVHVYLYLRSETSAYEAGYNKQFMARNPKEGTYLNYHSIWGL
jgi:hypothetical protein